MPGNRSGQLHLLLLNVSETFLETMEIPLLRGRTFQAGDMVDSAQVVIVNQTLARSAFPDEDPIDQILTIRQKSYRIVGICGDSKYYDLKVANEPTVFLPLATWRLLHGTHSFESSNPNPDGTQNPFCD